MSGAPFVDHYAALGCSPEAPAADLKRAYHEKLREFHPDKRPDSQGGTGQRVTQALVDAWEVLQDPGKREAYDLAWRQQHEAHWGPGHAAGDGGRLNETQECVKAKGPESLSAAATALNKYQAAIVKYTEGIQLNPEDHRIRSNRALCYAAVKDWAKCREDAVLVTQMKPGFMKGWFLLAKALWKEGSPVLAQRELDRALSMMPDNADLLALQEDTDIAPDLAACRAEGTERLPSLPRGRGGASRSVSPACTPVQGNSRVATPPPIHKRPPGAPQVPGQYRKASRSPVRGVAGEQTAHFGENTACFGDETAHFGAAGRGGGRSASPVRMSVPQAPPPRSSAPPSYAAYAAPAGEGTFGPSGAPMPPSYHRPEPAPPPRGAEQPGPRQKASLAGMAAASRAAAHP
ncbi:unnamed protein product [Prorocentrum cordatum]|uniref:J domain-containing protein n=1 Tax=Prorocentrum cordatum TaxID=2364126 RepID=A0ABN9U1Y9_9DINO|nr:unnamed protein product [Polarella glacialis]